MGNAMKPVVIPINASLSNSEFAEGFAISGIVMPAAWDLANITFQTSLDNVNFVSFFDKNGNEYVVTVVAGRQVTIPEIDISGVRYFKVRSGTAAAPVPQTAQRIIYVVISGAGL